VYAAAAYNGGGNAAKRMRLSDDNPKPSRVLHLRGIPADTTEAEIFQLTQVFGVANNIILTRSKNQALVEMSDLTTAQLMVEHHRNVPARIRSHLIHIQYSVHENLRVDPGNSSGQSNVDGDDHQHTILRVIVDNMLYPVTLDTLHTLFSKYGNVLRIITFTKNNSFQALVEFDDPVTAQSAKVSLNGQNIYNGCCALHIDFSKLKRLSVKYNNEKSRDYTNNQLGPDDNTGATYPPVPMFGGGAGGPSGVAAGGATHGGDGANDGSGVGAGMWGPYAGSGPGFNMGGMPMGPGMAMGGGGTEANSNSVFGCYPGPAAGPMGYGFAPGAAGFHPMAAMAQMPFFSPMMAAYQQAMGVGGGGGPHQSQHHSRPMQHRQQQQAGNGSVILVSNLDAEKVTPDALFTLFGVYGDVLRVKILFNKKDTAMIQFVDSAQAQRALENLDYVRFHGKQMKLSLSRHSVVQMPKEGTPDAHLTQDYTSSPLHRFQNPKSKNHLHIAPPSETLHLSNLPSHATEDVLRSMIGQYGKVVHFKHFEKDPKMALVQMSSVDEAVLALVALHNADLGNGARLRVTFTKSTIEAGGSGIRL
jgi:RNA recognition motif-containing protein